MATTSDRKSVCAPAAFPSPAEPITTPGTRLKWSSLEDWLDAWRQLNARAATSTRHKQRVAHVLALASNMAVVNRESSIATLLTLKQLIEREKLLPPRGQREGHPATEILQRAGTLLNERRRDAETHIQRAP